MIANVLASAGPGFQAPGVDEFYPTPLGEFSLLGIQFAITRITLISWVAVALVIGFFVLAARRPQLVPGRLQFAGESAYGLIRNSVAREVLGHQGLRYAPYLASLFFFILANNIMGIIPFAQVSPNAKFALPALLAGLTYIMFNYIGIRQHGLVPYLRANLFPPGVPWPMYLLVTPIEFASTFIFRPVTLAVRLFANMFAGHLLLAVFALGTVYLLSVPNFSKIFSLASFAMAIVMTFFELLIEVLQAYVFTVLTAVYLEGAMSEH
ncbi:MAG: F0F1 ATP synthase subunit A [Actinobacteria bacterium]|nr:F0F1 ATP synthase subunit A [Actinomycetota bacterium]